MAQLERGIFQWNGLPGGPGYSIFHWRAGNSGSLMASLKTYFQNLAFSWPTSISVVCPTTGAVFNDTDGKQTSVWSGVTALTITGTSASAGYTPQSGVLVQWRTTDYVNGRLVRGRFFNVPVAVSNFSTGGIVIPATVSAVKTAADSLITQSAGNLVIWSRPFNPPAGSTKPPRDGSNHVVISSNVPVKVATLKGRRDV